MRLCQIACRVRQLETLSARLHREQFMIQTISNPLLCVERRDYLAALRRSIHATEAARAALAQAKQRLEGKCG